jgi:hypothetical protein
LREADPDFSDRLPKSVWKNHWVVDVRCVGNGDHALAYLSRYIFQTATANRQVTWLANGKIRWPYLNSQTSCREWQDMEPMEWVRRFLQHVLPKGFRRVRYFGWFHHAARTRANRVRALLRQPAELTVREQTVWLEPPNDTPLEVTAAEAINPPKAPPCPRCGESMKLVGSIQPARGPPHQLLLSA